MVAARPGIGRPFTDFPTCTVLAAGAQASSLPRDSFITRDCDCLGPLLLTKFTKPSVSQGLGNKVVGSRRTTFANHQWDQNILSAPPPPLCPYTSTTEAVLRENPALPADAWLRPLRRAQTPPYEFGGRQEHDRVDTLYASCAPSGHTRALGLQPGTRPALAGRGDWADGMQPCKVEPATWCGSCGNRRECTPDRSLGNRRECTSDARQGRQL